MPRNILVSDESWARYPHLKAFIESEPADLRLLGVLPTYNTRYNLRVGSEQWILSLLQVCSLYGKTEHLKLLPWNPLEKKLAVKADEHRAILWAAQNGHTDTIKYLETHLTDYEKIAAVIGDDYHLIGCVAQDGYIDTLKHLETHLTDANKRNAIRACNHYAIQMAAERGHAAIVQHFLNRDVALAYLEEHDQEYGQRYVYAFVTQRLEELKNRKLAYEHVNPGGVFDLGDDEARLGFYMLRNLIRRGVARDYAPAEMNEDHLRFLLSIPAIKALTHTEVSYRRVNELLILAYNLGNETAARLLLDIPAVRELAWRNQFYRNERAGELDLSALAQDRESSMHALSQGEQKRLERAIQRYQPRLQAAGVASIIDDLRNGLTQYYQGAPAQLTKDDGSIINLPVSWDEFQALRLSEQEKASALQAYYQNPNHSALRYLSKPNHWMHERAAHVNVDEHNHRYRWSTFEEYQPIIAMLWLAAQDEELPPTEDHTLEGRIKHFIRELSLIGRAHNWDKTRMKEGKPQEYDDLEADRPSCFSGVKRRLFQSVIGHPLLKILTSDDLKQEVRDFALHYFKREIARLNNKEAMKAAFENYVIMLDEDSASPLACLNITAQEQGHFVLHLANKYGESFASNPDFMRLVQSLITLNPESQAVSDHYHALKLDGLTHLSFYLQQAPASQAGFFASQHAAAALDNSVKSPQLS